MTRHVRLHTTLDPTTFGLLMSQQARFGKMNNTIRAALEKLDEETSGPSYLFQNATANLGKGDRMGVRQVDECFPNGFPKGSLIMIRGPPGSGKTSLSLQFIGEGSRVGQRGVFFSFQESAKQLAMHCSELGWIVSGWHKGRTRLMQFYCLMPRAWDTIFDVVREVTPRRLVIDSLDSVTAHEHDEYGLEEFIRYVRKQEITTIVVCQSTPSSSLEIGYASDVIFDLATKELASRELHVTKARLVRPTCLTLSYGLADFRVT